MAQLFPELVVNASASDGVSSGDRSLTVEYLLRDVDGNDMADLLKNALDDSRLPRRGEANQRFDGFVMTEKTARLEGRRNVRVTCSWRPNTITTGTGAGASDPGLVDVDQQVPSETGVARVTVGASVVSVQTNFDVNGDLIVVTYNDDDQVAELTKNVPTLVRRFERLEPFCPEGKAARTVGRINALEWLGAAPFTYLCRSITGEPVALESGLIAWRVAYEFEKSAEINWIPSVVYLDPTTGNPPADAAGLNGIAPVLLYDSVDFNLLNLSIPV